MVKFDIVIATYNGSLFLQEQLDSILEQDDFVRQIYIRDDSSQDDTVTVVKNYQTKFTELIQIISDDKGNLGPKNSFIELCKHTQADYVAFADQDDIWEPNKLQVLSEYIEKHHLQESQAPVLIHSDLSLIDENGQFMGSSYIRSSSIDSGNDGITDLLMKRNIVTGCACVVNRGLLNVAEQVDHRPFHLHDFFFACIAALYDGIHYIDQPLIQYRQHGGNCVGFQGTTSPLMVTGKLFSHNFSFFDKLKKVDAYTRFDWKTLVHRVDSLLAASDTKLTVSTQVLHDLERLLALASTNAFYRLINVGRIISYNPSLLFRIRSL